MVYFDEFPKSILFVLAVSLVHASEFIPAFNLHSFQRHVDSVPCSQPRAQLLKKAHKKKDPRAMQLSSHCSLRKAGTQTNASSTTLIAQKQIYMYTCIYTQKKPSTCGSINTHHHWYMCGMIIYVSHKFFDDL